MLRALHIRNYALIESASLRFQPGLTAITGETGSGKSILLGAFALLLGERADHRAMRDSSSKCIAEAQFEISEAEFADFFQENDLDFEALTTVRREITPGGKSRSFINDTPVSLQVLKSLGERLVDVHSQHENSILSDRGFRFSVLDAYAGHSSLYSEYRHIYAEYRKTSERLEQAREEEARLQQNLDYIRFQLNELDEAGLDGIAQSNLEQELETLSHAGVIQSGLWGATDLLNGDQGALSQLQLVRQTLNKISAFHPELSEFLRRAESLSIEGKELAADMSHFAASIESNDDRMAAVQDLLNNLYRLQQKHRLQDVAGLISLREELRHQSERAEGAGEHITHLEASLRQQEARLNQTADQLHAQRMSAAKLVTESVSGILSRLQLGSASLEWDLKTSDQFNTFGKSEVELLFRANKGGALLPIRQVASGGEISRVMLALKASIAHRRKLPVLILDEIDQGVSGEVALRIGDILREISSDLQVVTITHLPQIAAKADHHFKVSKHEVSEETRTQVSTLVGDARVNELAEMLGGKKHTQASIDHARELLIKN